MLYKRKVFWLGLIVVSVSLNGFADRTEFCLNGEWDFQPVAGRGDLNELPKNNWSETKIRVPSSWTNPQKEWDYPDSFQNTDRAYYRRTFDLPAGAAGKRILVEFKAINFMSKIWVNGRPVGDTRLGYVPYEMDITSAAKPGAPNELIVALQGLCSVVQDGHALLPCGTGGSFLGLMDDVTLRIVPGAYISDVFVMPSVRSGKLGVQIEISNSSDKPFQGKASCDVLTLDGKLVKSFTGIPVNVPAGKTTTVTGEVKWSDAKLWWPQNPYLYKLRTRLYGAKDVDETCTRFGFREFWCDGPDFKLNGKRIRLMLSSTVGPTWVHGSIMQPEHLRAKWVLAKEAHVNIDRPQGLPFPQVVYDTADEFGMLIIAEGLFVPHYVSGVAGDTGHPDDFKKFGIGYKVDKFPELWKEYYRRWIRGSRNHPSIVMWSLFNEMSWNDVMKPLIYDVARPLDPTRPMYCDGTGDQTGIGSDDIMMTKGVVGPENWNFGACFRDMNGLADVLSNHYGLPSRTHVQSTFNPSFRFPHVCYYLDGVDIHKSRNDGRIKPACKGEYSYVYAASPDSLSFYGGDRAYQGIWALNESASGFWHVLGQVGRDEGFGLRYAGINAMTWWWATFAGLAINGSSLGVDHPFKWDRLDTPGFKPKWARTYLIQADPWTEPGKVRCVRTVVWPYLTDVQDPKLVLLTDPAKTFESGQKVSRRFALFNDTFDDAPDGRLLWTLNGPDANSLRGEIPVNVEHGRTYKGSIDLTLPSTRQSAAVTFTVRWTVSGKEWGKRSQEWQILPVFAPRTSPKGRELLSYDPRNVMAPVLKRLGRSVKTVTTLPDGNNIALLIAPGALDEHASNLAKTVLSRGGNVAILAQETWREGFLKPFGLKPDVGVRSMGFVRNPDHLILDGVNRDIHLCHWGTSGEIAALALEKPARGSFRDIVYTDQGRSLLLELRGQGGGTCVLTTLQLTAWSETNPAAKRILANLIDYLCTAGPWKIKPAYLVGGEKSPIREVLERMNVRLSKTPDHDSPILVDARVPIGGKELASLQRHLDAGGTMYIHGLTPETLKTFADLLVPIQLEPTRLAKCQNFEIASFHPLTGNLSGKDFYYPTINKQMVPFVLKRSSLPKGTVIAAAEPEWTGDGYARNVDAQLIVQFWRWKLPGDKTPGVILAVVPCRKGKIVICQLPWDEFSGYRNASAVGLAILNGLGVDLTAAPKPATYDPKQFVMVDIRPICNTGFVDNTPPEDGKGGWGDGGELNDLRDLKPGIHVDRGVPFRILDELPHQPNTCLILYSQYIPQGRRSTELVTEFKCSSLHFLHASLWKGTTKTKYIVEYSDKSAVEIPIRNGDEIDNWWVGFDSQARNAKIGWMGSNPSRDPIGLWHFIWQNPRPDLKIEKISFQSDPTSTSSVALVAVTAQVSNTGK